MKALCAALGLLPFFLMFDACVQHNKQQQGLLLDANKDTLMVLSGNELRYTSRSAFFIGSPEQKATGFKILRRDNMEIVQDLGAPDDVCWIRRSADGSTSILKREAREAACRLDSAGDVWELPSNTKQGRIRDGVLELYLTEGRTLRFSYTRIPEQYLLAVFFPYTTTCNVPKKGESEE